MQRTVSGLRNTAALLGLAFFSGGVFAQGSSDGAGVPTPPGGVRMGPLVAYPTVTYELQRNDNITLQAPNSGQVISDTIQVLKPAVRVEARQGANSYNFGLGAVSSHYSSSSADSVTNSDANAQIELNRGGQLSLRLRGDHADGYEPRGSTTDPLTPTPNHYRQGTLNGVIAYGAQGAQGRFELELGGMNKSYLNNRVVTTANDRSENLVGGTFFWRIAPKTSLLAQVKRTGVDFTDQASTLDGTTMAYLAGVTWEATAATTGIVKIGQGRKDFKDAGRADESFSNWMGQVQWSPLTYSKFDFATSREARETASNFGNFVLASNYQARWTHNWTSQFTTAASATYATDDYRGTTRNDKTSSLGLKGTYQMRRWLSFGASYDKTTRDSNIDTADYKKNLFMLFVNGTL